MAERFGPEMFLSLESDLFDPDHFWTQEEIIARPSPVPRSPGVYAWYFRDLEEVVPSSECLYHKGFRLLYAGISPSAPPRNGKAPSTHSFRHRIRYHYTGNAEGSTLRLTLGCVLAERLVFLRRIGSLKLDARKRRE